MKSYFEIENRVHEIFSNFFLFNPRKTDVLLNAKRYDILISNHKEYIVKLIVYHKDLNANSKRISTHVLWA